jgi:hypothetical protein
MTFLEQLQSHRGGLIRLKELYWYGGRGWDKSPDQICLLLDATASAVIHALAAGACATGARVAAALLLVDGTPHWVWVAQADVELL